MMQNKSELYSWADRVNAANDTLNAAQRTLQNDKIIRQSSLKDRFVDWVSTTPAEHAVEEAEAILSRLKSQGREVARKWVISSAMADLALAPEFSLYEQLTQRKINLQKRVDKAQQLLSIAENADGKLRVAEAACHSAKDSEFLDLISKSKPMSLISHMDTEKAKKAIDEASRAVRTLANTLPKRAQSVQIEGPDDFLDLVIDFTFDFGFDFMSWFNMDKLEDAARQCLKVRQTIEPLLTSLKSTYVKTDALLQEQNLAVSRIEAPYLVSATAQVPDVIRIKVPDHL
ncbi:hypothetical protein K9692_004724 [Escherichia coli]|nr:hypothetical protein [Escherichia coli]